MKKIYDNIYGFIEIEDYLEDIISDPFFLRLHDIKQLGLTNYVFPDGTHSRFSHSLGVYQIMRKMLEILEQKDGNSIGTDNYPEFKKKVLTSALLHDIGHLPLSHTIESALKKFRKWEIDNNEQEELDDLFEDEGKDDNDNESIEVYKEEVEKDFFSYTDSKLHEDLGEFFIEYTSIGEKLEEKGISSIAVIAGFKGQPFPDDGENQLFNRHLLHSQLDADRIDYLLRDSNFSGVISGTFDYEKLLEELYIDYEGSYGVEEDGLKVLEQFFMGRYSAYGQIVFNRKVHAMGYMASDFYFELLKLKYENKLSEINPDLPSMVLSYDDIVKTLQEDPHSILDFTDSHFHLLVKTVFNNREKIDNIKVRKYSEKLYDRKAIKVVHYEEALFYKESTKNNKENFYQWFYNFTKEKDLSLEELNVDLIIDFLSINDDNEFEEWLILKNEHNEKLISLYYEYSMEIEFNKKKKFGFINWISDPHNLKEWAQISDVQLENIIIPEKSMIVDVYDTNERDALHCFYDDGKNKENILKVDSCILSKLSSQEKKMHRVFTFEESDQKKLKETTEDMRKKYEVFLENRYNNFKSELFSEST